MDDKRSSSPRGAIVDSLKPLCDSSEIRGLTPEEIAALHMFKHEVVAAYWRLRATVPQDVTDPIIETRLRDIFEKERKKKKKS